MLMLMLMLMTSCVWFAAAANEGFISIMNPRRLLLTSCWRRRKQQVRPVDNWWAEGGQPNQPRHKLLCQRSRFSPPTFPSFSFPCFLVWQIASYLTKSFGAAVGSGDGAPCRRRQSLVPPAARRCNRPTSQLYCQRVTPAQMRSPHSLTSGRFAADALINKR